MKRWFVVVSLAACALALVAPTADAKRLGGGGTSGMKRELPPARSAPDSVPAKPAPNSAAAAPTPAAPGAAAAAAPKRSWLGPIAGLAAGLGIAALFSHLGMGAELGNFVMLALLALLAVVAVRWLMRRFASNGARALSSPSGMQYAGAAGAGTSPMPVPAAPAAGAPWSTPTQALVPNTASAVPASNGLPPGFDEREFERVAKMIFIRLQAANDAGDLNDLRAFTTPELFASLRLDLQERGAAKQQTDVVRIDAQVVDFAEEPQRQIVSVRFHGLIRETEGSGANDFDEVWHLVKPTDGQQWVIAGIQQAAAAV